MEELVYHVYRDVVTNDGDCFSGAWGVGGDEGKTDIHSNTCAPDNFT